MSKGIIMKRVIGLLSVLGTAISSAFGITYLHGGATGSGDGSSWENAFTSPEAAVAAAAAGDNIIYAAAGVYIVNAPIVPTDGMKFYGGFPGLSMDESLSDRDVDKYQTILSGDKNSDDLWEHVEPNLSGYNVVYTMTEMSLIADGKVNVPTEFSCDYDTFRPSFKTSNTGACFDVKANVGVVIEGLWIVGFNGGVGGYGAGIYLEDKSKSSTIESCRFVACKASHGTLMDNASSVKTFVNNTKFLFNDSMQRGSAINSRGKIDVRNCVFLGNFNADSNGANVFYAWSGNDHNIYDSTFARSFAISDSEWAENSYGGCGNLISCEAASGGGLYNCVISNNFSTSKFKYGYPLVSVNSAILYNCYFYNNRCDVKPQDASGYNMISTGTSQRYVNIDSCTFQSNIVVAHEVSAVSGSYSMGIVGCGAGNGRIAVVNTTFDDNMVSTVAKEGVNAVLSRGVNLPCFGSSYVPQAGIAACTFTGSEAEGVYDVAAFGDAHTKDMAIVNSVFTSEGEKYTPFYFSKPNLAKIISCNVFGMDIYDEAMTVTDLNTDRTPLMAMAVLNDGYVPARRIAVRLPLVRDTANVAASSANNWRYRIKGATDWLALVPLQNSATSGTEPFSMTDAVGTPRPADSYTRGAVQGLNPVAENGASLVLRATPAKGGSFGAPGFAQAVATGSAITPVEAIPANGSSFIGWYDGDGTLVSENNPLVIEALSEDKVIYAKFGTPKVALQFNLDGKGVFENGLDQITVEFNAGEVIVPPTVFMDDDYHFEGWVGLPDLVPFEDSYYNAQVVSKDVRVFCIVPVGDASLEGSDMSGSSWDNPTSDILAAYSDAARYRGELWFKTGLYKVGYDVPIRSNVALIGGFAGTETSSGEADPSLNPTIISGDMNGNTYWRPNAKDVAAAVRTNVLSGLSINIPVNEFVATNYCEASGSSSDDSIVCFVAYDTDVENVLFKGLTFACYKKTAINMSEGSFVKIDDCTFIANTIDGDVNAAVVSKGCVEVTNSRFYGNRGCVDLTAADTAFTNKITKCLFHENWQTHFGASIRVRGKTPVEIKDCVFTENSSRSESWRCSASITSNGKAPTTIEDCLFEKNKHCFNAHGNLVFEDISTFVTMRRNRFIGNILESKAINADRNPHSPCIAAMGAQITVFDSYFASNSVDVVQTDGGNFLHWGAVVGRSSGSCTIVNSTIVDNRVSASGANLGKTVGGIFSGTVSLVNSVVLGSVVDAGDNGGVFANRGGDKNLTLSVVNSIVSQETDITPFNVPSTVTLALANSSIKCLNTESLATGDNGYLYGLTDTAPIFKAGYQYAGGVVPMISLSAKSSLSDKGRPVYLAPDGRVYFYDLVANESRPWRRVDDKSRYENIVTGLTENSPLLTDALGASRRKTRVSLGPVNAPESRTFLMLK